MTMAKRPKTRIHHLADALEQLQRSQEALMAVDLRSCKSDLRAYVKASREQVAAAIEQTEAAMHADVPDVPRTVTAR
jgi:ribosomal protein S20